MDGKAQLYKDILDIAMYAINRAKPDYAVKRALERLRFDGDIYLVAVGKAAWQMADAAMKCVPKPICRGIVLTKYGHIRGGTARRFMLGGGTSHSGLKQRGGHAEASPNDPKTESHGYRPVFALRRRQCTF